MEISPALSKKVVEMLVADGLTVSAIAKQAGTTPAYLKKVLAGACALKPAQIDKLDDEHPDLPFRIGALYVKAEAGALAKKAGKTAKKAGKAAKNVGKKVAEKGGDVVESAARGIRRGAWKLVNFAFGGKPEE